MRAAILGVSLLLVAGVAGADRPGARAHFLAGLQLYGQGQYAAALDEYRAAWVTWEDPELLLDMAECNRHLGHLDEARAQYRGFLARAPHSPLRPSVERQLARLDLREAPPPAELTTPPAPPLAELTAPPPPLVAGPPPPLVDGRAPHAGRTARAIGIAGWAASALAMAVGIYTWSESTSLENAAHADLVQLRPSGPFGPSAEEQAFFQNPGCAPPSSLMGTDSYRRDCTRGQQLSDATTALFVGSVALGVAGTIAYAVGARQSARARERTLALTPVVGWTGGGLQLRYRF